MNETCNALSPRAPIPAGVTLDRPYAENVETAGLLADILQTLDMQVWLFEAHLKNRQNEK